jgi:dTDP-4-amino-4,6-dideoxygalactose transaminase
MLGYNYRMSEVQAAIGNVQLEKLPAFLAKRRENARRLSEMLEKAENLQLPEEPQGGRHSWYLYTVRLEHGTEDKRNKLLEELRKNGIDAEAYYTNPVHLMPYYRESFGVRKLPETEKAAKQVFSLPIHPGVTEEQVDYIGKTLLHLLH